jgi:protein N-terminal methyltransferase
MASTPDSFINHQDAKTYWSAVDADVNGMLGGFPYVSRVDLQTSKNFLAKLGIRVVERRTSLRSQGDKGEAGGKVRRAVDCGAG